MTAIDTPTLLVIAAMGLPLLAAALAAVLEWWILRRYVIWKPAAGKRRAWR